MTKILTVATAVQKAVLEQVMLGEIATGFWKNARPADHADYWKGVQINVCEEGQELGAAGFEMPRNYNFVNPDFFSKAEDRIMVAAKTANPDVTVKQVKKQLIALNQILGARLTAVGGDVTKLPRGRKQRVEVTIPAVKKSTTTSVRKVAVTFAEPETV